MATELILSAPASGKTEACLQRIRAVQESDPLALVWVVVPDRLQSAAFRERIAAQRGAMGTSVGRFSDLFAFLLGCSKKVVPVVPPALRIQLIQRVVQATKHDGGLTHYAPLAEMSGFAQVLDQAFIELKRALVLPDQFTAITRSGSRAQQELAALYAAYQDALKAIQWADPEGLNWLVLEELQAQPQLAAGIRLLIVDGFDTFTGAQRECLQLLAGQVGELIITLPGRIGSERAAHRRFLGDIEKLEQALQPRVSSLGDEVYLPDEVRHLEKHLFEVPPAAPVKTRQVALIEARSPAEEAREALRWIKQLVIRENVSLSKCMIFAADPDVYYPTIKGIANEFGMPVRFVTQEPLSQSPTVHALLNVFSLPVINFTSRVLLNCLRSPFFDFSMDSETIDLLEQICKAAKIIEGQDQWLETWSRLRLLPGDDQPAAGDEERPLSGLPRGSAAVDLQEKLEFVFTKLTPPAFGQNVSRWVAWLEDTLESLGFYQKLTTEREISDRESLQETLQAFLLSETFGPKGDISYAQFYSELQASLAAVSEHEPVLNQASTLVVGRMADARGLRLQAAALLGLSEGLFPVVETSDPFLDENLRAALGLESRLRREQNGLFYQAVTRTDQFLLLTRPYLTEEGEPWEESPYWKAACALFEDHSVQKIRPDAPKQLWDAASTQELLFEAQRQGTLPDSYNFLHERWNDLQHAGGVLKSRRTRMPGGPFEGYAGGITPLLEAKFSAEHSWSASRLGDYGTCPYLFFVNDCLGLEQRQELQLDFDALQLGGMLHKVLEGTFSGSMDLTDQEAVLARLEASARSVFGRAPNYYGFRPSKLWEVRQVELLDALHKSVEQLCREAQWKPVALEVPFGLGKEPPLQLDLGRETIRLHGIIDRVDCNPQGFLRVIDYKTGSSHHSKEDLEAGRSLQLPIYALAAQEVLGLGEVIEGFYWEILQAKAGSLKLSKYEWEGSKGLPASVQVLSRELERMITSIRKGEFPPLPASGQCPAYCPAAGWCWRFNPERKV